MKEIINNIKWTPQNIHKKNLASVITLIVEAIKMMCYFIFIDKITPKICLFLFIFSFITILFSIYIINTDRYNKVYKFLILDFTSLLYCLSNIVSGVIIESVYIKEEIAYNKKFLKDVFSKDNLVKPKIKLYHDKIVYIYIFISIILAYQFIYLNEYLFYILVFITMISFFYKELLSNLKDYKKNYKKIDKIIIQQVIMYIICAILSFLIIGLIVGETSTNEQSLNTEPPIILYIISVLYAPIVEELLYRGCLRKLIKNDLLFILISGISFGAWHVIGYQQSIMQYLYIIPYSLMGMILALTYTKTNNLTSNIFIHTLNNVMSSI